MNDAFIFNSQIQSYLRRKGEITEFLDVAAARKMGYKKNHFPAFNVRIFGIPIRDYPRDTPAESLANEKYNGSGRRAENKNI